MSKRGRKALAVPRQTIKVSVRIDLLAKLELLLLDPVKNKTTYGARTKYLESLIEKDLLDKVIVGLTTDTPRATMPDAVPELEQSSDDSTTKP